VIGITKMTNRFMFKILKARLKLSLTKQRGIKSYKKKKAILFIFLIIVDMHIWNGVIDVLNQPTEKIIIERVAESVSTNVAEAKTEDSQGGVGGDILLPSSEELSEEMGEFSGYTASVDETDDTPRIMASTKEVYIGAIACPAKFEFGTKIKVQDKIYTCEDRMNKRYRYSNHFDIFFETKDEAIKFGRRELNFEVIYK